MTDPTYSAEQLQAIHILGIAGVCPGWFLLKGGEWEQLVNDGLATKSYFTNEYHSTAPVPNERREKQLRAIARARWYLIPLSDIKRIIRLAKVNDWRGFFAMNRGGDVIAVRAAYNGVFLAFRPDDAPVIPTYIPTSTRDYRGRIRTA